MGDYYGPASCDRKRTQHRGYQVDQEPFPRGHHSQRIDVSRESRRYDDELRSRSRYEKVDDEWKCLECAAWNYSQDRRCERCGIAREPTEPRIHDRDEVKEEEELDEFGRSVATKMKKESFRWPPCFEKSGSEFVLDPRSGMFYEALSDFFYDPKSKLYYGNKNKTYYSYNTDTKKFEQVHKLKADDATEEKGTVDAAIILPGNYSLSVLDEKTPSISIKLKTKKLSSSAKEVKKEETKVEAPVPSAPRVSKNDFMNIEKWGERQEEIRQGVQGSSGKVTTTKLGEPICLLCKRKFPNLEKLEYHVKVSNLHKENLAKKSAQEKEKKREFDTKNVYVDRAKQRRLMFSTDSSVMPVDIHSVVSLGSQSQVASRSDGETVPPVNPQESLGESNIGNMLLQKLGWKNGSAIGRHQAGGENPGGETSQQQSALKQEWDRIESMASGIQTHRNQRTLGSEKH